VSYDFRLSVQGDIKKGAEHMRRETQCYTDARNSDTTQKETYSSRTIITKGKEWT
jgi:hypothetical protein